MRTLVPWLLHHLTLLAALFSIATLLGLLFGAGFFLGGASWDQALALARYLCLVLSFPSGLLWISHLVRDFRAFFRETGS